MKLISIILVTLMLLLAALEIEPQTASAQMDQEEGNRIEADIGLRIQLDIKPTSFSGSILFERDLQGGDSHRTISLSVVRGEEAEPPSMTRSIQDRFKAMLIITRVAARLLEKAVLTLL
jgi:hypothetical protein